MIKISTISLALSAILASNFSLASTPVLDERQHNQKHRIGQGIKSGELTVRESTRLIKGQRQLNNMERKAKSDGVVTRKERARLQHKANKESAKIARNKHDRQKRPKARN